MIKNILLRAAEVTLGSIVIVMCMEAVQFACILNDKRKN